MELLLITLIVAAAVWYLFRHFSRALKAKDSSCGFGACRNCPAARKDESENQGTEE